MRRWCVRRTYRNSKIYIFATVFLYQMISDMYFSWIIVNRLSWKERPWEKLSQSVDRKMERCRKKPNLYVVLSQQRFCFVGNIHMRWKPISLRFILPVLSFFLNLDTKVLSIIRCWKNGAIISVDNLETSGMRKCFFLVRVIWVFMIL